MPFQVFCRCPEGQGAFALWLEEIQTLPGLLCSGGRAWCSFQVGLSWATGSLFTLLHHQSCLSDFGSSPFLQLFLHCTADSFYFSGILNLVSPTQREPCFCLSFSFLHCNLESVLQAINRDCNRTSLLLGIPAFASRCLMSPWCHIFYVVLYYLPDESLWIPFIPKRNNCDFIYRFPVFYFFQHYCTSLFYFILFLKVHKLPCNEL